MHKYLALRGCPNVIRRVIEDIQDIHYKYTNKKTGKMIGALQLMPREIKGFELAFPATAKDKVKEDVMKIIEKYNKEGLGGGVAVHWGPWKKDKFYDGLERI